LHRFASLCNEADDEPSELVNPRLAARDPVCKNEITPLIEQFTQHYHEERPHHGLENERPVRKGYQRKTVDEPSTVPLSMISCKNRLGGLLKHYHRKAA
jgi:hypothetical protein